MSALDKKRSMGMEKLHPHEHGNARNGCALRRKRVGGVVWKAMVVRC